MLGKGVSVLLQQLAGWTMCPVAALRVYLVLRPPGRGPLLVHEDGTDLSQFQFQQVFRKGIEQAGLDPKEFSSQSFRIGAAMEAARWGLGPDVVKHVGYWESDRYRLYICLH